MAWRDLKYSTRGAVIGGLIGAMGSVLRIFFWSMNNDPFGIFGIPGIALRIAGIDGCNWKSSSCPTGDFFGYIITIVIFSLIGLFIGSIVGKIKSRK